MKKILTIMVAGILTASMIGCAKESKEISVISREDGSGTRGAFIELMGIQQKDDSGNKKDMTTKEAAVVSKTDVMISTIAGDKAGIGYISLGSLNDTVKAVKVDGVDASTDNVKNGSYKVSRPFIIATKNDENEVAQDFISYILSADGQAVVSKSYIEVNSNGAPFTSTTPTGKITVAGSSSVTPIMEKLKEAYNLLNPNATIEIQMTDSTAGMTGAIDGTCDIGMASRNMKDSEKEVLTGVSIALDGIAVIVNNENTVSDLTSEEIRDIYTGTTTEWQ